MSDKALSNDKVTSASNFSGMVFSERLQKEIPVFHKKNESDADALKRVEANHKVESTSKGDDDVK